MLARPARPAAAALLAVLAGCAEEPSFQLAWRISTDPAATEPDDAPELLSVTQCSEVGIEKVRLEVRGADDPVGTPLRFVEEYGCFPSAFGEAESIDGPTLPPGEYELELIGLRRSGGEWLCPSTDIDGNEVEIGCVRDQGSVTVREGELPELAFLLLAPEQCDDGVDNDRDGRVDASDPACTLGESLESYDAGLTIFQLSVEILGNSLIEPQHVDIDSFAFEIDGQPFDSVLPVAGVDRIWPWRFRLLDARLDAGSHTLSMVALSSKTGELTQVHTYEFMVDAETGAFEIYNFQLGSADFLAPIEKQLRLGWTLGEPGETSDPCASHQLAIDQIRVRVSEEGGFLGEGELLAEGVELEPVDAAGWHSFSCAFNGEIKSAMPLLWDESGHEFEFEAHSGDTICFETLGPRPTRPSAEDSVEFNAARVLDDLGQPPPGCEECTKDDDCQDLANLVCTAGLCAPK